jgi:hypothetical protein
MKRESTADEAAQIALAFQWLQDVDFATAKGIRRSD